MSYDSIVVEGCVTSPAEAAECFSVGARRVELCRALEVGGLTAGAGDLDATLAGTGGPVFALVRRQAETFRLNPAQVAALVDDVEEMVSLGAHGVVVGVLDASGRIDVPAVTDLVSAAGGLPVTFHRAYDELDDPVGGIELLIRAGVARVLTSGGAKTAWEGRAVLREMVEASGTELAVLGGGSVRGDHVRALIRETGLHEVHARASAIPAVLEALGGISAKRSRMWTST